VPESQNIKFKEDKLIYLGKKGRVVSSEPELTCCIDFDDGTPRLHCPMELVDK